MERLLHSESRSKLHLLYVGFGTSSLSLRNITFLICRRRDIPSHFYNASQLHSILTLMWASVGGRIMVPQRYAQLNPQNLWICPLHGKSNFTDVTRDLRWECYPGLSRRPDLFTWVLKIRALFPAESQWQNVITEERHRQGNRAPPRESYRKEYNHADTWF